eukprot:jgi/Psemu1/287128/fgenesh1_pg.175_\
MSSKPRGKKRPKRSTTAGAGNGNRRGNRNRNDAAAANDAATVDAQPPTGDSVPPPLRQLPRILTHADPLAPTTVLEGSKIKNFLYKEEPNMPKLKAPALELISATAALLLKSVVEQATLVERSDRGGEEVPSRGEKGSITATAAAVAGDVLITTNHLKRAVVAGSDSTASSSPSSCLGFLAETYEGLRDKDVSVPPSRRQAYVPRSAAAAAAKRRKRTAGTSVEMLEQESVSSVTNATNATTGAGPLEKAIADATAANETTTTLVDNEIVEDDDDYD